MVLRNSAKVNEARLPDECCRQQIGRVGNHAVFGDTGPEMSHTLVL